MDVTHDLKLGGSYMLERSTDTWTCFSHISPVRLAHMYGTPSGNTSRTFRARKHIEGNTTSQNFSLGDRVLNICNAASNPLKFLTRSGREVTALMKVKNPEEEANRG
jgi:hypothetical protein